MREGRSCCQRFRKSLRAVCMRHQMLTSPRLGLITMILEEGLVAQQPVAKGPIVRHMDRSSFNFHHHKLVTTVVLTHSSEASLELEESIEHKRERTREQQEKECHQAIWRALLKPLLPTNHKTASSVGSIINLDCQDCEQAAVHFRQLPNQNASPIVDISNSYPPRHRRPITCRTFCHKRTSCSSE